MAVCVRQAQDIKNRVALVLVCACICSVEVGELYKCICEEDAETRGDQAELFEVQPRFQLYAIALTTACLRFTQQAVLRGSQSSVWAFHSFLREKTVAVML